MQIDEVLSLPQYSVSSSEKQEILLPLLKELVQVHSGACPPYFRILKSMKYSEAAVDSFQSLPFLPVRLFKELELKSISDDHIFKVLTSSGTTSQRVSRIYLDKKTSILQTKALATIIMSYLGPQRLPMVIIDSRNILKNRSEFSARGAGILGLSNFGREHLYLLDENMEIDFGSLQLFLKKHAEASVLFFGFTFMVWQYLIDVLAKKNIRFNVTGGILIHSGGWKKLKDMAVTNITFKEKIQEYLGVQKVYNFYGMVEQVGGVYMECERGYFHSANFTEIIIRSPKDFQPCEIGTEGIVQTISILPLSYPGNSILTEDLGVIHGIDDCACGRKGTYFTVSGRIHHAELRGCSDAFAYSNSER